MNYPLISEYIEAIKSAEDNFGELSYLRPILGDDGLPVMTSGNFAVIFKMKDEETGKLYAVKCFTREQEGRAEAYREIVKELKDVSSPYLASINYIEKELFVDTQQTDETEFPVLLMDWVEGKTLDKYLRENLDDKYALEMLAYRFSLLAQWLIPQPFAHGDLKPDNILVREDGTLVLVDYDGMYVPTMKGQKARELGSPDFRHPLRTENDFDEHIDDFPLVSILLSLKAISYNSQLLEKYGTTDSLLLSVNDYLNIHKCEVLSSLLPSDNEELNILCSIFVLFLSTNFFDCIPLRLIRCNKPKIDAEHYYELGEKYRLGFEVSQDCKLAFKYYKQAAKQGSTQAQCRLGNCYRDGSGTKINTEEAIKWYRRASKQGNLYAMFNLACVYNDLGDKRAKVIYEKVFTLAFELSQTKNDASAIAILGMLYLYGMGVKKNEEQAITYLTKACQKNDNNALTRLGMCYYRGIGVSQDYKKAVAYFERGAYKGDAGAERFLGLCYLKGFDVKKDLNTGVSWLEKASNQGDSVSQRLLGLFYLEGIYDAVVNNIYKANQSKGVYWLEQSASRGDIKAEYNLGFCFENGIGTKFDREKARFWYDKAAQGGNLDAKKALEKLDNEDLPF